MPFRRACFALLCAALPAAVPGLRVPQASRKASLRLSKQDGGFTLDAKEFLLDVDGVPVSVVSMLHLADGGFYDGVREAAEAGDAVLFEMIADEDLLRADGLGMRRLAAPVHSSGEARAFAASLGLETQVEALGLADEEGAPGGRVEGPDAGAPWIVADLGRQELAALAARRGESPSALSNPVADFLRLLGRGQGDRLSLLPYEPVRTDALVQGFRAVSWLVPAPELSLLLVDWAAVRPSAGGLSRLLSAMWDSLLCGELRTLRKLTYAQQLASSQRNSGKAGRRQTALVDARNDRAARDVLEAAGVYRGGVSLLYGAYHTEEIVRQLRASGARLLGARWRTAWRIPTPQSVPLSRAAGLAFVAAIAYLIVDALDWQGSVLEAGAAGDVADALSGALAYIVRHGLLYYAMSQWLVQWDRPLIEGDRDAEQAPRG